MSPDRLLSETIGEVIKSTSGGKVFGVALKDRGAILPAGRAADGAYWFSSKTGKWESSTYYSSHSPPFLKEFNSQNFIAEALAENWTLEGDLVDKKVSWLDSAKPVQLKYFEYDINQRFNNEGWNLLKAIPYGNQMTADFAMELIKKEKLGTGNTLDFLSLSFSATDYVGHNYGVESAELVSTYIELDKTIAEMIDFLDQEVGKDNYLLFLSSDHGADLSRAFLTDHDIKSGRLNIEKLKQELEAELDSNFGEQNWIITIQNLNVYFNKDLKKEYASKIETILDFAASYLQNIDGDDNYCLIKYFFRWDILVIYPFYHINHHNRLLNLY